MKDRPAGLLSVIIPVYNRRELLGDAVESVIVQDLPEGWDMEVVIVDDGSTDGTGELAAAWTDRDQRVRDIHMNHSGFPGAVRNRGVRDARGSLLAFLDSDDRWLPGKLYRQIPAHCRSGALLSHTRERWNREGRIVSQSSQRHKRAGDIFADALHKCIVGPSTAIVDAGLFRQCGGFRDDLEVAEDYEFWLRLLCHTNATYLDEELTEKRAGPWDQLSERYGHIEGFRIAALRRLVDDRYFQRFRSEEAQRAAERVLVKKMAIFATGARKRGRHEEASLLEQEKKLYQR